MAATKAFTICRARQKTISYPIHQGNMSISFIFVFLTIQPVRSPRGRGSQSWVDYTHEHETLLLFDAAYEAYISDPEIPHSIFEVPGALECAIELRSFSKNGGFTGIRCGFTVMPNSVLAQTEDGRHCRCIRFGSVVGAPNRTALAYPVQRGAEALYSAEGRKQVRELIDHYMGNAKVLRAAAADTGLEAFGGINAPYIWVKTPDGLTSWQLFDRMLRELNVVITPGAGFGAQGEGYFRISAFNSRENAEEVARRLKISAKLVTQSDFV